MATVTEGSQLRLKLIAFLNGVAEQLHHVVSTIFFHPLLLPRFLSIFWRPSSIVASPNFPFIIALHWNAEKKPIIWRIASLVTDCVFLPLPSRDPLFFYLVFIPFHRVLISSSVAARSSVARCSSAPFFRAESWTDSS